MAARHVLSSIAHHVVDGLKAAAAAATAAATNQYVATAAMVSFLAFVAAVTWQADDLSWPLARLSQTNGIVFLNILAKFSDFALEGLMDTLWEKLTWGPLLHRNSGGGGNLLIMLVMQSGGFWTWVKVFFHRRQKEPQQNQKQSPQNPQNQQQQSAIGVGTNSPSPLTANGRTGMYGARLWSFAR